LICSSAFYMDYRTGKHCEPPVCYPGAFGCTAFCQKTFVHLLSMYDGRNNGDLACAWKIMSKRGWKSEQTLQRAKLELLDCGFIAETRKGARPNKCSLYGLTWQHLNPCEKFDIKPAAFPFGAWERAPPNVFSN
jgi:hypothetical protein